MACSGRVGAARKRAPTCSLGVSGGMSKSRNFLRDPCRKNQGAMAASTCATDAVRVRARHCQLPPHRGGESVQRLCRWHVPR